MSFRSIASTGILTVASLVAVGSIAAAQAPWQKLNMFRKVEADPEKGYEVTDDNGPWMIMAATFAGKGGEDQARQLVLELRKKFRLEAYMHSKQFDYTDTVKGLHVDKYGNPKQMKYRRAYKSEEFAVLVGNYASADDPQAQRDLEKIKALTPEALKTSTEKATNQQLASWRKLLGKMNRKGDGSDAAHGPMSRAFVTTNPLLPEQFFVTRGIDKFVEKMNSGVKYSLLDCPGKFTVQVATFTGKVVIDQSKVQQILAEDRPVEGGLVNAAEKAHTVCMSLREKGYEAYEFHDRGMSIVTVGSFDSVGTPFRKSVDTPYRKEEKTMTELDPKIHKIMQTFAATDQQLPGNLRYGTDITRPVLGRRPKSLDGITLDSQPLPVTVPKRSFSSSFGFR
ncbi:MAG: hypothetical protein WD875_06410 [Pirellulales bacterium]